MNLIEFCALEARNKLMTGEISAYDLTHAYLDQISDIDEDIDAWSFLDRQHALNQARAADETRAQGMPVGALFGLPVAVKDIFDTYEKVEKGFVDETHLKMRMHMLKLGTMKAPIAQSTWKYWRGIKSKEFVEWFETEIYGDRATFKEGYQEEIIPNVRRD